MGRPPKLPEAASADDQFQNLPEWLQGESTRRIDGRKVWFNYTHKFDLGQGCDLCVEKGIECRAELPRYKYCAYCRVKVGSPPFCNVTQVAGLSPSRRGHGRRAGPGRGGGGPRSKRKRHTTYGVSHFPISQLGLTGYSGASEDSDEADESITDIVTDIKTRARKGPPGGRPSNVVYANHQCRDLG